MAKAHKNAYDGDQSLAELAAQIDGNREEDKKPLSARQQAEKDRKNKAFTVKWRRMNYAETMTAFYSEVSRLAGYMERWKREELKTRGMAAMDEYHNMYVSDSPFDKCDEASRLKAQIHRLRYRGEKELPGLAYEARIMESDEKKALKYEAEAERNLKEKMPAAAFRIYELWCSVAHVIQTDTDQRMVVKLSDYEEYDYEYEEDL